MRALALDLGASGGKMFLGDFNGKKITLEEIHRFDNAPILSDGHLTWDIKKIYSNLKDGLRKAGRLGFESFGVDSFCNDYGLLNKSGNLLAPVYMYRDNRTQGTQAIIDERIDPEELYRQTGCQRARFNTLTQLVSQINSNEAEIFRKAENLLFIPELLGYYLTGEKTTEYTIASVSQLYNRLASSWDQDILDRFEIPKQIFTPVIPTGKIIGNASAKTLELTASKPFSVIAVGHHDTASAVAAVSSVEKHFAYISSGTWSLMGTETDSMITTPEAFRFNFANEGGLGGKNRFLKNIMGLWLVQEIQRDLASRGISRSFEELDQEAEQDEPFRTLINPDDALFYEPGDMIEKIQSRSRQWNQPVPETSGEITRCIKESLALVYRRTLEKIEQLTGFSIPVVHIIGGGARSKLLNQFAASAMNRTVLVGPLEAAAIGNLCAQFMARGGISGLGESRLIISNSFTFQNIEPNNRSVWDDAYSRFVNILDS